MEDLEKLRPNIRVIDFNTLDLKEFDFNFKHPTLGKTSISNYYKNLYPIPKDKRINFGSEIDLMRVLILLKAGEALIESEKAKPEEIPDSKAAIYFDFDIQPNKEGKEIGKVKISEDILISHSGNGLENAIMAVSGSNNSVLKAIHIKASKNIGCDNDSHGIYHITKSALSKFIADKYLIDDNISIIKKYDNDSKWQLTDGILRYKPGDIDMLNIDIFGFEYNSNSPDFQYDFKSEYPKRNVCVSFDRSWKCSKGMYESNDLLVNLDPPTSLEQHKIADTKKEIQK